MLTLTDADNGQPVDIAAGEIAMVRVLDARRTELTLRSGHQVEVREARHKVRDMMRMVGALPPRVLDSLEVEG